MGVYQGSSATLSLTKFPAKSVAMFLNRFVPMSRVSNVPLFPDSSVRAFHNKLPGRSVPMSPASNVQVFPASSVPMFQDSNVMMFLSNNALMRKGFMEENKETL